MQQALKSLISSGRYDTRDDFTVVLQPVTSKTRMPRKVVIATWLCCVVVVAVIVVVVVTVAVVVLVVVVVVVVMLLSI